MDGGVLKNITAAHVATYVLYMWYSYNYTYIEFCVEQCVYYPCLSVRRDLLVSKESVVRKDPQVVKDQLVLEELLETLDHKEVQ